MKRLISISAVAVLLIASTSCQKENDVPMSAEPITGYSTFTATIDAPDADPTKTTIDPSTGVQTWRAGDQILVSNGKRYLTIDDDGTLSADASTYDATNRRLTYNNECVAEWITITSEMISKDGKTLEFTRNVADPWSSGKFCFFVTGATPYVYSMSGVGQVSTRRIAEVSENREDQVPQLIASCAKDETHVSFKNTLAFVSFNCSADYYAATIIPNSGPGQTYKLNPDLSELTQTANTGSKMSQAGISAIINNDHQTWHLPLTPGYTYSGGFTFILWPNEADYNAAKNLYLSGIKNKTDWTGFPVIISTSKDFTPEMGTVIDLGDVYDRFTYYDRWQAGKDITIGGVAYNKNVGKFSGVTATRITSNQNISSAGVYFVADGVTVTLGSDIAGNIMIVGDNVKGTRAASLVANGKQFTAGDESNASHVLLKGLSISNTNKSLINFTSTTDQPKFIIDNCVVTCGWIALATLAAGTTVDNLTIVDSDIKFGKQIISTLDSGDIRTITALKILNSVFYAESVTASTICIGSSTTDITNVDFIKNTFVNMANANYNFYIFDVHNITNLNASKNYFYRSSELNKYDSFRFQNITNQPTIVDNYSTNFGLPVRWENGLNTVATSSNVTSQFNNLDLSAAKPDFSLNTTDYGAQR